MSLTRGLYPPLKHKATIIVNLDCKAYKGEGSYTYYFSRMGGFLHWQVGVFFPFPLKE
jgi:hypothetical protein